jgi:hypothetical protein
MSDAAGATKIARFCAGSRKSGTDCFALSFVESDWWVLQRLFCCPSKLSIVRIFCVIA